MYALLVCALIQLSVHMRDIALKGPLEGSKDDPGKFEVHTSSLR